MSKPVTSVTILLTPLVEPGSGVVTAQWGKWFQGIQEAVNGGLDQQGNIVGNVSDDAIIGDGATVEGRTEGIGTTLRYIDAGGEITGPGIDFARPYLRKDTDHIGDATGSPLAGGTAAYAALVASAPSAGQVLAYTGTAWAPQTPPAAPTLPASMPAVAQQWLNSYNAATGAFTQTQPAYADLSGTPTLPASASAAAHKWLASYNAATGAFTLSQPDYSDLTGTPTGASGTITLAALTAGTGTPGSITVVNGIITAFTNPT